MRAIALFFALIGVSAAATIYAMDDQQMEEVMKDMMARSHPIPLAMSPSMGFGDIVGQHDNEEVLADEGIVAERDARETGADETLVREMKKSAEGNNGHGHQPSGFEMMGMMFPEMIFTQGAPEHAPLPYSGNGQAASNGNGHSSPVNGNGHSRPVNGNNNGKRGGGAAAAASTSSFSKGPNSYSASQAQAFSFGNGN